MDGFGNPLKGLREVIIGPKALDKENQTAVQADIDFETALAAGDVQAAMRAVEKLEAAGAHSAAEIRLKELQQRMDKAA